MCGLIMLEAKLIKQNNTCSEKFEKSAYELTHVGCSFLVEIMNNYNQILQRDSIFQIHHRVGEDVRDLTLFNASRRRKHQLIKRIFSTISPLGNDTKPAHLRFEIY